MPGEVKLRLGRFYAAVRKATPHVQVLAERYGGDVAFSFDSNGRSVWVMALFGKGAPPLSLLRRAQDRLRSFETPQDRSTSTKLSAGFETARHPRASSAQAEVALRDSPSGFLRVNGI